MNKSAIQKYAIWARNELIEQVKQRAYQYGISEKGYGNEHEVVISGRVLTAEEQRQRQAFVVQIQKQGYQQVVEEVAYTWFNRFVALRFMEVNDYLPTHVRVFSDSSGNFNPEILKDALHLDLPGLDKAKVSEYLNTNKTEELYRYLLLTQCNALNEALPEMFERLGSYTEMLLPNNILKADSVPGRLVTDIPEENFRDAVQIIGWMYQYYNTEPKQAVFDGLKKNIKITKEKIPAATQLFTPDWIVRYMVENSLGRLWLESHPNDKLRANWKYYLDEAEQTPEVTEKLRVLRSQSPVKSPEDIKLIDPCMGSGHILVYAFDVLMQIYTSEGYSEREATKLILEKNLFGLDIDRRAYQLAYFSLMMKARQYNRRIFTDGVKPQVYHPIGFPDGEEYGSLVKVSSLPPKPVEKTGQLSLDDTSYDLQLNAWNFERLLVQKYDVVVTNPPYMGGKGMNGKLSTFVESNFPSGKQDLYAAFIVRGLELIKSTGFSCMVTMQSWLFLTTSEKMRKEILNSHTISNLLHMDNMVMGIAFGTAVANLRGWAVKGYIGAYNYVEMSDIDGDLPQVFPTASKRNTFTSAEVFSKIPGSPVAYWASDINAEAYENYKPLSSYADVKKGLSTADDNRFLRLWHEISSTNFQIFSDSRDTKWYRLNKGGSFRRWYGNNEYVIDWKHDGAAIRGTGKAVIRNAQYYFRNGITWTYVTNYKLNARKYENAVFVAAGPGIFAKSLPESYVLAFLNTCVAQAFANNVGGETITYEVGEIASLPVAKSEPNTSHVVDITDINITLSRTDWDSFETSWDFKVHPLVELKEGAGYGTDMSRSNFTIKSAFKNWETSCNHRFTQLKANEEELNSIFIDIYGLQDELTSEVADKDVTVRRANLGREVRSFISYAVGCMFGRYSLDAEGLAYAGGKWDAGKYRSFIPDKDNILPICDDDYFDDDILRRFVDFVRVVYGAETLEENLKFIADALGGKGTSREGIRNYFLNGFFTDHCKIYQKRPIYWLFDSGTKNGFKALIYLHRYSSDLLAKLRTDYVHEQQERYRTQLSHIDSALNSATGSERARLLKQQDKLSEQLKEITFFEEKIHYLADQNIEIDLDDGVKVNYAKFPDVLAKI